MATAVEYALIAAGIGIAIVTSVNVLGTSIGSSRWDDNADKKLAAAACAARPAGDTSNVVIRGWLGRESDKAEYKCSDYPWITYPTFVRHVW